MSSLETVRAGGAPCQYMAVRIQAIKDGPMNEGPGEGYHRGSHLTRRRAPNVGHPYALANQRWIPNRDRISELLKSTEGVAMFRRVWRHYKGVLQAAPGYDTALAPRPIKCNTQVFSDRLYRLDEMAAFSWDALAPSTVV